MANNIGSVTARKSIITGLFRNREAADNAYQALVDLGYSRNDINLVMSDETRNRYYPTDETPNEVGHKTMEGAGVGGAIGTTVGAILGALAAIGTSLVIPGLGLVIAGPIVAALAGAGAGSITGGLIGGLIGAGIPEDAARAYEKGIREGGILISVEPRSEGDAERIEREWKNLGGELIR